MFSKKRFRKVLLCLVFFILVLVLGSYIVVRKNMYLSNKISFKEETQNENLNENTNIKKEEGIFKDNTDYIQNILLIGTDNRGKEQIGRADTIIIATIDKKNKKVKFSSILRDMYVSIKKHGNDKINSAYAYGGAELLVDTIYSNLNIKIDKYIIVDFLGFQNIIDKLGGIDIDIKDYEIKEINKFIGEFNEVKSRKIEKDGIQTLDGQQVLAYARIRKVGNGSYERSLRQRNVLTLVIQKILNANITDYKDITQSLMLSTKTNIEPISLIGYAFDVSRMNGLKIEGIQIPKDEYSKEKIIKGSWVIWIDKEKNSKYLNDFIYGA